ncbi:MAG: NUDIX hydrolase [Clostridia bacterium]|nr:NUDIX hydrolase [Clostridia bacterium]
MAKIVYDGWMQMQQFKYGDRDYEKVVSMDGTGAIVTNKEGKILLVRQYRPCVGMESLEIVAGCIDKAGEDGLQIIKEELEEEAHIKPENIVSMDELYTYYMMIGSSDAKITLYDVVVNVDAVDEIITDDDDVTGRIWVTLDEMKVLIDEGKIADGKTIIAYQHLKMKNK